MKINPDQAAAIHFTFGDLSLNTTERTLLKGTETVTLPPKVFDTLCLLVQNSGRILSKEVMMAAIWDDTFVEENNLAQNISVLRKVLGETADQKFIETVPKFGYRFVAPVAVSSPASTQVEVTEQVRARVYIDDGSIFDFGSAPSLEPLPDAATPKLKQAVPETRYVQNGDVNIAYQVVGDGPIDIVFVMGWISHLEYFWKHHLFASFLDRLASFSRLILFDKRGTGLSDRVPINQLPTLEQRMEDVHAVMNAVGSKRAVLIGVSEGGPMCSLFAATYPERTSALVMIGTYAKRIRDKDYPWAPEEKQRQSFFDVVQQDWGKPVGIEERAPSMAADPEFRDWWATYLRMGASPGAAVALTKMNADIDVRNVLPLVRVPTLVMHRTGDLCLKVEEGRFVASQIPGSKFVEFDGDDHLPFVGDQTAMLDEIERFVTGAEYAGEFDRVLATVLNIRISNFRVEAEKRSDAEWNALLDTARDVVARQLELFRGKEAAYDKKGIVAAFDGPARAIRCSASIVEAAKRYGIGVKTGLHTGECDVVDGNYSGVAVELARKIADESEPGNILVSRTVKDLVAGSGISFAEHSVAEFPGIDGEWRLFNVIN
jgi:pimeloyl-ACP methyl ester carboxylesterase/DNA-binding winged helix-turn-helix (wHTH) protein/class 3 adenylate cyclase